MNIRLLAATLAMLLSAGIAPAFADVGETTATARVYVSKNVGSDVVGVLSRSTQVEGQCYRDGWCQISGGGLSGWVQNSDVVLRSLQPQQPQPMPTPQAPGEQPRPQPNPGWPWPQPQPDPWPQPQPQPPRPPVYEAAEACFFSEPNFRGSSFCMDQGDSFSRLRTWENAIRSVQVFGGARVKLCSEQNYFGDCGSLRSDTSRLPGWLDGYVSSVEVY